MSMRERAKQHFHGVLLTLVSIVQALALELLWSSRTLFEVLALPGWHAWLVGMQWTTSLIGVALVWIFYAANVMRLVWVPTTLNLLFPFLVGILQFTIIDLIGPESLGAWFIAMGMLVTVVNVDAHNTMRRSRLEPENAAFFEGVGRATLRDFLSEIVAVASLLAIGVALALTGHDGVWAALAVACSLGFIVRHLIRSARFWHESLARGTS